MRRITWRRVMDMNDRALRSIVTSLGGVANGFPREDGFDITVASEVMAIFCLSTDLDDLTRRLGNIIVGYTRDKKPVYARDLKADGAMTVLLKDALMPNLVQTLEDNPAFVHGGPFANIAHGCNSVIATKTALKLADYVVTEAGFGADLGAEKFFDIKCRKAGLKPDGAVIVATVRALKMHGGVAKDELGKENVEALKKGFANLARHVENVQQVRRAGRGRDQPLHRRYRRRARRRAPSSAPNSASRPSCAPTGPTAAKAPRSWPRRWSSSPKAAPAIQAAVSRRDAALGQGPHHRASRSTAPRASSPTRTCATSSRNCRRRASATTRSASPRPSTASPPIRLKGAPSNHVVPIREVRLSAGAEFIVVVCGEIMTMPGLPKVPAANSIFVNKAGQVEGLF